MCTVHPRVDHLLKWDDYDFRVRFRLGKDVVLQVLEYIEDELIIFLCKKLHNFINVF